MKQRSNEERIVKHVRRGEILGHVEELTPEDWADIYNFIACVQQPFLAAIVKRAKDRAKKQKPPASPKTGTAAVCLCLLFAISLSATSAQSSSWSPASITSAMRSSASAIRPHTSSLSLVRGGGGLELPPPSPPGGSSPSNTRPAVSMSFIVPQVVVADTPACDTLQALVQRMSDAAIVGADGAALLDTLAHNKRTIDEGCKRDSRDWFLLVRQLGLLQAGRYEEVESLSRRLLLVRAYFPPEFRAHVWDRWGQAQKKMGHYDRANASFRNAARESEGSYLFQIRAQFFTNWAWNDYYRGDLGTARVHLRAPLLFFQRQCASGACSAVYQYYADEGVALDYALNLQGVYDIEPHPRPATEIRQDTLIDWSTFGLGLASFLGLLLITGGSAALYFKKKRKED